MANLNVAAVVCRILLESFIDAKSWSVDGRLHAAEHATEHRAAKGIATDATEQHVLATHDSDPRPCMTEST